MNQAPGGRHLKSHPMEQACSLYEGLKASETNGVAAEKLGAGRQFEHPPFLRREGARRAADLPRRAARKFP